MPKISILGFGNPVREDDGVGVYVAQALQKALEGTDIDVFDMGTSAFEVLFKLKGCDRIILVDAVINTGEPVGTLYKLPASEIEGHIQDDPMVFLHSLKWDQALSYARKMFPDDVPPEIEVYLIAIDSTRFDTSMTEAATAGADRVIQLILDDLKVASSHTAA
jgi:hydrogenase maturation protease